MWELQNQNEACNYILRDYWGLEECIGQLVIEVEETKTKSICCELQSHLNNLQHAYRQNLLQEHYDELREYDKEWQIM